ncbi:MAG: hypothetical protein IT365_28730 [Candidatus Hydrogenedentes bacterium]|nr:hypothetical protein [Candidatus Hydrogenedentota bacterium]
MSNEPSKSLYLLLIRGTHWESGMSPDDIQRFMGLFTDWCDRLADQGKVVSSHPLAHEGKLISGKGGRTVADGPFAESKEAVGGFFLLEVDSAEEAMAIAKASPVLEYGGSIEVRPVIQRCSTMDRAAELSKIEQGS